MGEEPILGILLHWPSSIWIQLHLRQHDGVYLFNNYQKKLSG